MKKEIYFIVIIIVILFTISQIVTNIVTINYLYQKCDSVACDFFSCTCKKSFYERYSGSMAFLNMTRQ